MQTYSRLHKVLWLIIIREEVKIFDKRYIENLQNHQKNKRKIKEIHKVNKSKVKREFEKDWMRLNKILLNKNKDNEKQKR